ncbi:MAG: Transcriptional regulator of ribosomal biogenesis proteins [Chrysothrix sp. TS-e1954]|nr:MAG: Transcriptional regulator of ribosomal biogenesis proteins [Chrysothrix sp. TS-e1954]
MADVGSPYAAQSPSYHSSSYLPKMEANFWNNLRCCEIAFKDLHELMQHLEEVHYQAQSTVSHKLYLPGSGRFPRRSDHDTQHAAQLTLENQHRQVHAGHQWNRVQPNMNVSNGGVPGPSSHPASHDMPKSIPPAMMALQNPHHAGFAGLPPTDKGHAFPPAYNGHFDTSIDFLNPGHGPAPLDTELANMMSKQGHLYTPASAHADGGPRTSRQIPSASQTPIYGSSNTTNSPESDRLHTPLNSLHLSGYPLIDSQTGYDLDFLQHMNGDLESFNELQGNGMSGYCIDDPATSLYAKQAGTDHGPLSQSGMTSDAASDSDEAARQLQAHHLAANIGTITSDEDRRFKCPVIGCEKAYKNANGLRYHEKHGHASQKLKQNGDGTFSIINPETSQPYPGTLGMEKEKPFRCEACGKRYKNLNGLKYHRNHSSPCNPELNFIDSTIPSMTDAIETDMAL